MSVVGGIVFLICCAVYVAWFLVTACEKKDEELDEFEELDYGDSRKGEL